MQRLALAGFCFPPVEVLSSIVVEQAFKLMFADSYEPTRTIHQTPICSEFQMAGTGDCVVDWTCLFQHASHVCI